MVGGLARFAQGHDPRCHGGDSSERLLADASGIGGGDGHFQFASLHFGDDSAPPSGSQRWHYLPGHAAPLR